MFLIWLTWYMILLLILLILQVLFMFFTKSTWNAWPAKTKEHLKKKHKIHVLDYKVQPLSLPWQYTKSQVSFLSITWFTNAFTCKMECRPHLVMGHVLQNNMCLMNGISSFVWHFLLSSFCFLFCSFFLLGFFFLTFYSILFLFPKVISTGRESLIGYIS
jgi:hypothetical protein